MMVIDEIARMRYQQAVFDNAMLGLRLGDKPRLLVSTTPRPTAFMKKLVAMAGISITTGMDIGRHGYSALQQESCGSRQTFGYRPAFSAAVAIRRSSFLAAGKCRRLQVPVAAFRRPS